MLGIEKLSFANYLIEKYNDKALVLTPRQLRVAYEDYKNSKDNHDNKLEAQVLEQIEIEFGCEK